MTRTACFNHPAKLFMLQRPVTGSCCFRKLCCNFVKVSVHLYKAFRSDGHEVGLILRGHGLAQYEAVMNLLSQLGHARIIASDQGREYFLARIVDGLHLFLQKFLKFRCQHRRNRFVGLCQRKTA